MQDGMTYEKRVTTNYQHVRQRLFGSTKKPVNIIGEMRRSGSLSANRSEVNKTPLKLPRGRPRRYIPPETLLEQRMQNVPFAKGSTIRQAVQIILTDFSVGWDELVSRGRKRRYSLARASISFLLTELKGYTDGQVARLFEKDVTTVRHWRENLYGTIREKACVVRAISCLLHK